MSSFDALATARHDSFRLSPQISSRPRQLSEISVLEETESASNTQEQSSNDDGSDIDERSTELDTYHRQIREILHSQMEAKKIATYQKGLYSHTRTQLLRRRNGSSRHEDSSPRPQGIPPILPVSMCVDLQQMAIRGDSMRLATLQLSKGYRNVSEPGGKALRNTVMQDSSEDSTQKRCRELMGGFKSFP